MTEINACKGCTERWRTIVGDEIHDCHMECEKYLSQKKQRELENEERKKREQEFALISESRERSHRGGRK